MTEYYAEPYMVESPFEHRKQCWFCGELVSKTFIFPNNKQIVVDCVHPVLSLSCCTECYVLANKSLGDNIWQINYHVKKQLMRIYQKDLAIGLNWTKKSLANSGFEGGNFEGFQRSAWFMYEVAKQRVNFKGWPLVISGITLVVEHKKEVFVFDGVTYPSIDLAIEQYALNFGLDKSYLTKVLTHLGKNNFAKAVRFCRLQVGSTPAEKQQALKVLLAN